MPDDRNGFLNGKRMKEEFRHESAHQVVLVVL